MDPTTLVPALPAPPETTDPVTWIAIVLVCVLIIVILVGIPRLLTRASDQLKAAQDDAKAERKQVLDSADARQRETLTAFRDELGKERELRAKELAAAKDERQQALEASDARHRETLAAFRSEISEERELRSKELAAVHNRLDAIHRDVLQRGV
jgi:DNA anti-recombination protein RmuC